MSYDRERMIKHLIDHAVIILFGGDVSVYEKSVAISLRELYAKENINGIPTARYIIKNTVNCSEYMNNTFILV